MPLSSALHLSLHLLGESIEAALQSGLQKGREENTAFSMSSEEFGTEWTVSDIGIRCKSLKEKVRSFKEKDQH